MNGATSESRHSRRTLVLIRAPLLANFVLLFLLVGSIGQSHQLYEAMRKSGLAIWLASALQAWLAGTTIVPTAVFFWMRAKKADPAMEQPSRRIALDGALLLAWWVILVLVGLYAFSIGMGG